SHRTPARRLSVAPGRQDDLWDHEAILWYGEAMIRVGVRELKDNLSNLLKRASEGETVEVTEYGHPLARIVPAQYGSRYEQMVAEGRIIPAEGDGSSLLKPPPPLAPGERLGSDILAELRADER